MFNLKDHFNKLYKRAIITLNSLAILLIIISSFVAIDVRLLSKLILMWDWVCLTITLLLDTSIHNVLKVLIYKKVAFVLVLATILLTIIMIGIQAI